MFATSSQLSEILQLVFNYLRHYFAATLQLVFSYLLHYFATTLQLVFNYLVSCFSGPLPDAPKRQSTGLRIQELCFLSLHPSHRPAHYISWGVPQVQRWPGVPLLVPLLVLGCPTRPRGSQMFWGVPHVLGWLALHVLGLVPNVLGSSDTISPGPPAHIFVYIDFRTPPSPPKPATPPLPPARPVGRAGGGRPGQPKQQRQSRHLRQPQAAQASISRGSWAAWVAWVAWVV